MLSKKDPSEPLAKDTVSTENESRESKLPAPGAVLNPRAPIEVASSGSGTVNDPSVPDTQPPGAADLDLLI
jgi:hypothetical protein